MSILANESVKNLFTITETQWSAINGRVGSVLAAEKISSIISQDLPGYPALLVSSKRWVSTTFPEIAAEARAISGYCDTAITNFMSLYEAINKITEPTVPEEIKRQVLDTLNSLKRDTSPIASNTAVLASTLRGFLQNNQVIDSEIALNKEKLGDFWAPLGGIIDAVESATGSVTGAWSAISNDLDNTITKEIDVTMPFIESLDIQSALICWNNVKTESMAFASKMQGQNRLWLITN